MALSAGCVPAQPPVSSSSTLWATASKEWVIPAKPKPGRKPKVSEAAVAANDDEEVDSKGRRVQNRAAQRAFRERKQSQLAELQARVHLYEQGEIERNVALQNIAKRLKEENEQLRKENLLLKERVSSCEKDHIMRNGGERKRWREESSAPSVLGNHPRKRSKIVAQRASVDSSYDSSVTSTPSHDSPRDILSSISLEPPGDTGVSDPPTLSLGLDIIGCGFCTHESSCFCRDMALRQVADENEAPRTEKIYNREESSQEENSMDFMPNSDQISILEHPPAFEPPVPLRRRDASSKAKLIFPISAPSPQIAGSGSAARCSGDPTNCMACADDSFGQAFCAAIGESVASTSCEKCPCTSDSSPSHGTGRGNGTKHKCDLCQLAPPSNGALASGTITTDDAWRQLKSHPNVAFNDLSLLADVVARRSKCTGPRVVISPALGTATPERAESPHTLASVDQSDMDHEVARKNMKSPLRLVPQEVLIECGRRSVREVRADAVREALHLLDTKFSRS